MPVHLNRAADNLLRQLVDLVHPILEKTIMQAGAYSTGIGIGIQMFSSVSLCLRGKSKPCLDAGGEGAEVAYSRDFVIRELDAEVIL